MPVIMLFVFFKQKTAYEMRISDWSSDVCSSDLVSLVKDSVDRDHPSFNMKSARAKLMSKAGADTGQFTFGPGVFDEDLAHKPDEMACFTCHLSWTTSCGGCHPPIEETGRASSRERVGPTV